MPQGKGPFTVSHAADGAVQTKTENLILGLEDVITVDFLDKSKSGEVLDRACSGEMGQRRGRTRDCRYQGILEDPSIRCQAQCQEIKIDTKADGLSALKN